MQPLEQVMEVAPPGDWRAGHDRAAAHRRRQYLPSTAHRWPGYDSGLCHPSFETSLVPAQAPPSMAGRNNQPPSDREGMALRTPPTLQP